ncbi:hypothetical protein CR513_46278, partial [Mucuna pruriens]
MKALLKGHLVVIAMFQEIVNLHKRNVKEVEELRHKNAKRKSQCKRLKGGYISMSNLLTQGEQEELLYPFMEHFVVVSIKILDLNPKVALRSKNNGFEVSLCIKAPTLMNESPSSRIHPSRGDGKVQGLKVSRREKSKRYSSRKERKENVLKETKYHSYTPFNYE